MDIITGLSPYLFIAGYFPTTIRVTAVIILFSKYYTLHVTHFSPPHTHTHTPLNIHITKETSDITEIMKSS